MSHPQLSQGLEDTFSNLTPPVESLGILDELKRIPPMDILEVGVGNGFIANSLASAGHRVTGMDLFDGPLAHLETGIRGIKFDVERDEVPDSLRGAFDVILALAILEHVHYEQEVLTRLASMLKPGGRIYASTPNIAWWPFRVKYLLGRTVDDFHNCDHVKFWNLARFKQTFVSAGFEVERHFTSLGLPNPLSFLVRSKKGNGYEMSGKWLFLDSRRAHPLLGYNQVVVARKQAD